MRTARYYVRLLIAFLIRFKKVFLISSVLGVLLFLAFRNNSTFSIFRNTEKIGLSGRYTLDELPPEILSQVSEGLTKVNTEGIVEPALAESWSTPDDGITWEFRLKNNVFWHDGEKVTSDSINYEFSDAEVAKPDQNTIVFKLKNPFSPFPAIVSRPVVKRGLIGTGNYKVDKLFTSGSYVEKLTLKNDKKEKITYKFYPTEEGTKLAFKLGQVDQITEIFNTKPLDDWNTVKIEANENKNRYVAIFFNTEDRFLAEKSARQALSYAINKDVFDGSRAISPISPFSWAYNSQVKSYAYDEARAKTLMGELPDELTGNLNINLTTTPLLLDAAENIKKDWEKIGVKTDVNVISSQPGEFQAFLTVVGTPLDPDQYTLWHSTQTLTNVSRYKNPRIDKLLEEGRIELDFEKRKSIYFDFQRFLLEDAPAVFLYHPVSYTLVRK